MPIYLTTVRGGRTTEAQRSAMAEGIITTHCGVTGAPRQFVNAFFSEQADKDVGFPDLPDGKVAFLNATIRAGRTDEDKGHIRAGVTKAFTDALQCSSDEILIEIGEVDATHCIEGGKILPVPGSPEEEAWKKLGG